MDIPAIQLNKGEHAVTLIRRHWYHIAVRGFVDVFVFTCVALLIFLADSFLAEFVRGSEIHTTALSIYLLAGFGLLLWMHFFAAWSDHWLDAWVITNERIIDIEQKGFFRRQVSSFPLDRIQDVTFETNGLLATLLHFGNVRMQTASISDDLIMKQVPFPEDIKEVVAQTLQTVSKVGA